MSITLTAGATVLSLSPDLYWADELDWQPVEQAFERTITGAGILSVAARVKGRPITLRPFAEDSAWTTRGVVEQLRALAAVPGLEMTLALHGATFDVVWRHADTAIEAAPVHHYADRTAGDYYRATLRFMEV